MKFFQTEIKLRPFYRGFHLITHEIEEALVNELKNINIGQLQVFVKHTSASITINENADPTVRLDMEAHLNKLIPENMPYYKHTYEGSDDMPAHIKASFLGSSVAIPITNGRLNMGVWQGVYLGEHRNYGGQRTIVVTLFGQ